MDDGNPLQRMAQPFFTDETCWRVERADKLTVIIDAADYFRHLRATLRTARRTIYLIGWDFDLRLEMLPGESDDDGNAPDGLPNRLGDFLEHIVQAEPGLSLHILKWDKAMLMQLAQQAPETLSLKFASDRIHFALDSHHPVGATHHQKIVVVDDRMAFCGGIDVTGGRWDTRDHAPDDPRRKLPDGTPHKPWHDVTTALSGPIAVALGDLARRRWKAATGDDLTPPTVEETVWPDDLQTDLRSIDVAVARTEPDYHEQDLIDEIEQLYVTAIGAARDAIYVESQYFASGSICRAIEERMSRSDAPELVVVNPEEAEGFLEHELMDTARARMIERVRAVAGDRFRIYHPVNEAGEPIYVHAKVLIVDDRLVRIGSSNINNRSMGFDTECDVAFAPQQEEERAFALGLRHSLLGEHLGVTPDEVARAVSDGGSLIAAVESLNGRDGRRLVELQQEPISELRSAAGEKLLFEEKVHPRNRPHFKKHVSHGAMRAMSPYHIETMSVGTVVLAATVLGVAIWAGIRLARRDRDRERTRLAAPAVIRHVPPRETRTIPPARPPLHR